MLPFVALPSLPPIMAQVLMLPTKPVKPGVGGKAVVKFRISQSARQAKRLQFLAFYPDIKGKGPGAPYPNVSFLPPEMLVPPGARSKTARATFDVSGLTFRQKVFICSKTIPKAISTALVEGEQATGTAMLSVLSCGSLWLEPSRI